jgi:hypothetical protein
MWEERVTRGAGKQMGCGQMCKRARVLGTCIIYLESEFMLKGGMEGVGTGEWC